MPGRPRRRRDVDPGALPAPARWVLRAERSLRRSELPPALRRGDDPKTPSPVFLLAVMVVVGTGGYLALAVLPPSSAVRALAAPAVLALWAGKVVSIEPGRLAGARLGPWLPAVGWWLGALLFLELFLEGWARPRPAVTTLEAVLAGVAGMVAWGKARLEAEA